MRIDMQNVKKPFRINKSVLILIPVLLLSLCAGFFGFSLWKNARRASLSAPSALTVEGGLLSWPVTKNAVKYRVSVDGTESETAKTVFDLQHLSEARNHSIQVKALGDPKQYKDSDWSEPVMVEKLSPPALEAGQSKLSWTPVTGNHGYELFQNGVYLAHMEQDVTEYSVLREHPEDLFQILAKGDGAASLDSALSPGVSFQKLTAPGNVTVTGTVLRWEAVEGAEQYLIEGGTPTYTHELFYDAKELKPGRYELFLQAIPSKTETGASDKVPAEVIVPKKPLGALSGLRLDGRRVYWNRLPNASGYEIAIKQNNQLVRDIIIERPDNEFLDLSGLSLPAGSYVLEITALGNEEYENSKKESISYTHEPEPPKVALPIPKNFRIEKGVAQWKALPEADGYVLLFKQGDVEIHALRKKSDEETALDITALGLPPADYVVSLYALGNGSYGNSPVVSLFYTVKRLDAPKNLAFANGTLSWSKVSGAEEYLIAVNRQTPARVTENSFALDLLPGGYTIAVQAVSKNREIQPSLPTTLTHTEPKLDLETPENIRIEKGVFKWDELSNAAGYAVEIKSVGHILHTFEKAPANGREVDLYALDLPLGDYTVTLQALGDEVFKDATPIDTAYQEKMIRDAAVRTVVNYGNKFENTDEYWIMHYLNFSLKRGFTLDSVDAPPDQWNSLYESFLGGSGPIRQEAAEKIGQDIMVTYYYQDDQSKPVALITTGGIPFVKNKLWDGWLHRYNGHEYVGLQGSFVPPFSIGGIVPQGTTLQVSANIGQKNPAGGGAAMTSVQLAAIKGRTLFVDVDVILRQNDRTETYKETVSIDIPDF